MNLEELKRLEEAGWDVSDVSDYDKLSFIVGEVKSLPIADIMMSYGLQPARMTYNKVLALCPFHMDEHIGSFVIDTTKNSCFCYSCNKGGDAIHAMSIIWNKPYIDTALQIATDFKVISEEEFVALSGVEYTRNVEKPVTREIVKPRPSEADLEARTAIYEYLRDYFGLTDEDHAHLKDVRKLSEERIKRDYFSFKVTDDKEISRIVFNLRKDLPEYANLLPSIPGFFLKKHKDLAYISMLCTDSIGILLRNAEGKVVAIQTRDKAENADVRYSFYSWKIPKGFADLKGGASVGTPIDVCWPEKVGDKFNVAIVEGRFKSEILAKNGMVSLSVQGVNNFQGIENDLAEVEEVTGKTIRRINIFYDADQLRNGNVFKAGVKLSGYLEDKRPDIEVKFIIWPPEEGKGIDDLILSGKRNLCRAYTREFYQEAYERNYDAAIAKSGIDMRNLSKISKEDRAKFFDIFEELNRQDFNM